MSSSPLPPSDNDPKGSKQEAAESPTPAPSAENMEQVRQRDPSLPGDAENDVQDVSTAPSDPSPAPSITSEDSDAPPVRFPRVLESAETYECIGFTPEMAKKYYDDGKIVRDRIKVIYGEDFDTRFLKNDIEEYLIRKVTRMCDDYLRENDPEDWEGALDMVGVDKRLKEAIMDPEFEDVRGTQSLPGWLEETIRGWFGVFRYPANRIPEREETPAAASGPSEGGREEEKAAPPPP